MMNQAPGPAEMEKLQCAIQAMSRMNFYLWMYLAQEGIFEEAYDFIREKLEEPLPFEAMLGIHPWIDSGTLESPFDPF